MHRAVQARQIEAIEALLLEGGADAAAEDDAGVVPLHLAEDDQAVINAILDE